jgi:putative colanic acid biosynthesis acetyltransferase WcaF
MHKLRDAQITHGNLAARALWGVVWVLLFRPTPRPFHFWRRWLLRAFGAKLGRRVRVYQSARIWAPWNLTMEDDSCLGDDVDCYSVAPIHLEQRAVVSQYCFLCTATHDYTRRERPLQTAPIRIGADAWVTARALIGPGVTVGAGAVVGAGSIVMRDIDAWAVVAGNPPRVVNQRKFSESTAE